MSDYRNEDDWQIELRRLKADEKFKVCRLNCGSRLTTRSVRVLCFVHSCSQCSAVVLALSHIAVDISELLCLHLVTGAV